MQECDESFGGKLTHPAQLQPNNGIFMVLHRSGLCTLRLVSWRACNSCDRVYYHASLFVLGIEFSREYNKLFDMSVKLRSWERRMHILLSR